MKEFVIDRSVWARGKPDGTACLLREDGKMCCLGIYLRALGMKPHQILGKAYPSAVRQQRPTAPTAWLDETSPVRLLLDWDGPHTWQTVLAYTNDDAKIEDADREKRIRDGFAANGIAVSFVGEPSLMKAAAEEPKR